MTPTNDLVEAIIKLHSIALLVEHQAGNIELADAIHECANTLDKLLEESNDIQQDKGSEGSRP
jgi:hypothetical protein